MCGFVRLRSTVWLVLAVFVSPVASRADQSDPAIIEHVQAPWTGDLDQMGDLIQAFEQHVNEGLGKRQRSRS
ncbi:MAG TPA: hypothetical protein VFV80_08605 [Geminicoccaceae bacterium]|nr:hypothetical protein [Geminicoccaceae bacterium]